MFGKYTEEIKDTKFCSYGNKKQPYGHIKSEIENKTSKNNKNDETNI